MTARELEALLERITYKPGTRFELQSGEVHQLVLHASLPHATMDGNIHLSFGQAVDIYSLAEWNEYDALEAVRRLVLWHEQHEVKEWLKLDGKCLDEPHPERTPH